MRKALMTLALTGSVVAGMLSSAAAFAATGIDYARIPDGAYSIVASVRAKPGREAELRAVTLPLVALVRSDPKNLIYFLQEDRAARGHFVFYEVFASRDDFEAHNAMPYVKDWFAKLPALAEGGVEVKQMEILGQARP